MKRDPSYRNPSLAPLSRRQLLRLGGAAGAALALGACGAKAKPAPTPAATAPGTAAQPSTAAVATPTVAGAASVAPATALANSRVATSKTVAAAKDFLASLSADQKTLVSFDFGSSQQSNWSNFPQGIFQRKGVNLGALSAAQQAALFGILETSLSPAGYKKTMAIVDADEVLKGTSGGGGTQFGRALYFTSILGSPSLDTPWMWQFGGHHLALNGTIVGQDIALTPSLTGAQPASFTAAGATVRPLGGENDRSFKLLDSLTAEQRGAAVLGSQVANLALGPGKDGQVLAPVGVACSTFNPDQQALLADLAFEWLDLAAEEAAALKLAEFKAGIPSTYFSWSGATANGGAAYYRIQGPAVVIEYAPQGGSGTSAPNHIHAMFRDPTNDYGARLIKR